MANTAINWGVEYIVLRPYLVLVTTSVGDAVEYNTLERLVGIGREKDEVPDKCATYPVRVSVHGSRQRETISATCRLTHRCRP